MLFACAGDVGVDDFVSHGLQRAGGCSLNVAAHLRRCVGVDDRVEIVSAIGDDEGGEIVARTLRELGIDQGVARLSGATPCQRIQLEKNGERRFVGYEAGVLATFEPRARDLEILRDSDVVMAVVFEQITAFFERILVAPRHGRLCIDFMDLSDFGKSLARARRYLEYADVAFFGLSTADDAVIAELERWVEMHDTTVVVTLGGDGSLCLHGQERVRQAAVPVASVVDTTGAGDSFAAAFASRYFRGDGIPEALRYASELAAKTIERLGAF